MRRLQLNGRAMMMNYLEMLDSIKWGIFTGEMGGLYMLARGIACICACVSLIWWYNKYMNDPFAQLDIRSIIKALAILALTWNFYTLVLMPFDHLTTAVTRGITAFVDCDRQGLDERYAELMRSIEEDRKTTTLQGEFEQMMQNEVADTTVTSGMSFGTSSYMESIAEETVSKGEDMGFWENLWESIKMGATMIFSVPISNSTSILSWVITLLAKIVQYILMAVSSVFLIILGLVGPFSFALALMPGFTGNIRTWLARYIQISFWIPLASMVDFVNFKMRDMMISFFWTSTDVWKFAAPTHLIILDIVTIICLLAVPSMSSWVISGSGGGGVMRSAINTAAKAFMLSK